MANERSGLELVRLLELELRQAAADVEAACGGPVELSQCTAGVLVAAGRALLGEMRLEIEARDAIRLTPEQERLRAVLLGMRR